MFPDTSWPANSWSMCNLAGVRPEGRAAALRGSVTSTNLPVGVMINTTSFSSLNGARRMRRTLTAVRPASISALMAVAVSCASGISALRVRIRAAWAASRKVTAPVSRMAPTTMPMMVARRRRCTSWVSRASAQSVPDAPDRRQRQGRAQLLAELADVDVHGPLVAVPPGAPHPVQQLLAGEGQARVGRQELEEVELPGRQGDDGAAHPGLPPGQVDLDRPRDQHLGRLAGPVGTAQDGPHPRHQLAGGERLGHVVVGPQFQAED